MKYALLFVVSLLTSSTSAFAAEGFGCLEDRFSIEQRQQIASMLENGQNPVAMMTPTLSACATAHGWTPQTQQHAAAYVMAASWREALRSGSPLSIDDLTRVTALFDQELDMQTLETWVRSRADGPRLDALIDRLGISDPRHREWLDGFFGVHAMARVAEARFLQS